MADEVQKAIDDSHKILAKANAFTNSVTGNATDAFAPKTPPKSNIPQAHAKAPQQASYGLAAEARSAGEGLKAKADAVNEVAPKQ